MENCLNWPRLEVYKRCSQVEELQAENKSLTDDFNYAHEEKKKLQAELAKHRWIPVAERLPEEDKEVLVFNSDGVRVAERTDTGWWNRGSDSCGCCYSFDNNITHWKPIILPEKEK